MNTSVDSVICSEGDCHKIAAKKGAHKDRENRKHFKKGRPVATPVEGDYGDFMSDNPSRVTQVHARIGRKAKPGT